MPNPHALGLQKQPVMRGLQSLSGRITERVRGKAEKKHSIDPFDRCDETVVASSIVDAPRYNNRDHTEGRSRVAQRGFLKVAYLAVCGPQGRQMVRDGGAAFYWMAVLHLFSIAPMKKHSS